MSTLAIAGLIMLIVVIIVGVVIKKYTTRKLDDIDGVSSIVITTEGKAARIINK